MRPIEVPRIIDCFSGGGYSMALAPGVPLGSAVREMSRLEALRAAERICDFVETSLLSPLEESSVTASALEKLQSLSEFYESSTDQQLRLIGSKSLKILWAFFSSQRITESFNHGDLSFENLLVTSSVKHLTAIDFLDSPFDSAMIDVGRLWLDLRTGWWADGLKRSPVAILNSREMAARFESRLRALQIDRVQMDLWASFAALRIAPYTRNPTRLALLKSALGKVVDVY